MTHRHHLTIMGPLSSVFISFILMGRKELRAALIFPSNLVRLSTEAPNSASGSSVNFCKAKPIKQTEKKGGGLGKTGHYWLFNWGVYFYVGTFDTEMDVVRACRGQER